jgi:hypothetical protein
MHVNVERELNAERPDNRLAEERAKDLADSLQVASEAQTTTIAETDKMAKYYDAKRTAIQFNIEDQVRLTTKNIRTRRASKKLAE